MNDGDNNKNSGYDSKNSLQSISTSSLDLSTVLATPYPNCFSFHSILQDIKDVCISTKKDPIEVSFRRTSQIK